MVEHKWFWCRECKAISLACGTCGNNVCNSGYGQIDGVECPDCEDAHLKFAREKASGADISLLILDLADHMDAVAAEIDKYGHSQCDWAEVLDHAAEMKRAAAIARGSVEGLQAAMDEWTEDQVHNYEP